MTLDRIEIAAAIARGLDSTKDLSQWSADYQKEMLQAADEVLRVITDITDNDDIDVSDGEFLFEDDEESEEMEVLEEWMLEFDVMTPSAFLKMWRSAPVGRFVPDAPDTMYCQKRIEEMQKLPSWSDLDRSVGW